MCSIILSEISSLPIKFMCITRLFNLHTHNLGTITGGDIMNIKICIKINVSRASHVGST